MSNHIKKSVFLPPNSKAEVAQLVEHNLAKVGVASSSLVFRSNVETQCIASLFILNEFVLDKFRRCIPPNQRGSTSLLAAFGATYADGCLPP